MTPLQRPPSKILFVMNDRNSGSWIDWFFNLFTRFDKSLKITGYAKASLTTANGMDASQHADATFTGLIYVTDATGGATLAFSNGTDWISTITGSAV